MIGENRIILAADRLTLDQCLGLAEKIGPRLYAIKIHNLYDRYGPDIVRQIRDAGANRVWVDVKLHDIPNTVALRAKAIADSGADILSVHATGGEDMIRAAVKNGPREVFAVTVLTSLKKEDVAETYRRCVVDHAVTDFAVIAEAGGAHGVVCSPMELHALRKIYPNRDEMKLIVPGIRSKGQGAGDQQRIGTPAAAIKGGANYLVIGRPLTQARDPIEAFIAIQTEIMNAEAETANEDSS